MNIKKLMAAGLPTIVALLLSACGLGVIRGSGNLVTETRGVSGFDRVDVAGSGEVVMTQGEEESLTVETDGNIMRYVTTEVRGGTLYLGFNNWDFSSFSPTRLRFTLNVKDLVGVNVSGSGDISAASLDTDRLDIVVSGSGDVRIDSLTAQELDVRISGSGEVELAGEAIGQNIDISGSGEYHGGDLRSGTVEVTLSGSGSATVWATEFLDARTSGSGSVGYYGNPRTDVSSSGSGQTNSLGQR